MAELGLVCFKLISFREKNNNNNQQNKELYPQPTNSAPEPQTTTSKQGTELRTGQQYPKQSNSAQNRQTLPKNQGAFPQNTKIPSPKTPKKPIRIIFLG